MNTLPETETKSEFADRCRVDRSAVSHWIASGKLGPEALVGEGRSARIRVDVALAQLRQRLDIGQRLGNGLSTRLHGPTTPQTSAPPLPLPLAPGETAAVTAPPLPTIAVPMPELDPVEEKIKRERLAALERENRRKAEEEAERAGRYVERSAVHRQMTRIASTMLTAFEGRLPQFATAVAERFGVPQRDVLHLLAGENRKVRARVAEALRRQAEDMPRLIEEESEAGTEE